MSARGSVARCGQAATPPPLPRALAALQAAAARFGSGWAWLGMKDGKLVITSTPNQVGAGSRQRGESAACARHPGRWGECQHQGRCLAGLASAS